MNLFDNERMAAGYARSRPAVHSHVIERIGRRLGTEPAAALDLGCGTGLSTAPLAMLARRVIGIEPSASMLRWAPSIAPRAMFAVGSGESMPVRAWSIDLVTAAGSLNWSNLDHVFAEVRRVLAPGGKFVIYDYGQSAGGALERWRGEFTRRYPMPPSAAVTAEGLEREPRGFRIEGHEAFGVGLRMDEPGYVEYAMTETNVAAAIERGTPEPEIRSWCAGTVAEVFGGRPSEVTFGGFIAYLSAGQ